MKSRIIGLIVIALALTLALPVEAHKEKKKKKRACATCFTSQVTKTSKKNETCTEYEITVSYSGTCKSSLSHFTVSIPRCASLKSSKHTNRCGHGLKYDPVTGLTGLIFDDLEYFGKTHVKSFKVSFALCGNSSTCKALKHWDPVVAYATSSCYELDTLNTTPTPPTPTPNPIEAHIVKTDTKCDSLNGSATVVIDKGTPPFTYLWSTGSTDASIENIGAGSYTVNVTDSTNNVLSLTVAITGPPPIVLTPTITNSSCAGLSTGAIDLAVTGGAGEPYTYSWSNGATTQDMTSLRAGSYTVTVMDSTGCSSMATYSVGNSKQLLATLTTVQPGCGQSNGSLTIVATGGTEPYTYLWSNGATTATLSDVPQGLYSFKVTDAEGCSLSRSQILRENNTLKISFVVTPTTCLDDNSGAIDVTVTGGLEPYSYNWSSGETTEDLSGLAGGTYTLTVMDAVGCDVTTNISVFKSSFQVNTTVIQPQCFGDATTGSIAVSASGGVEPHTYLWSTGATTTSIDGLLPGSYSVTVTDATGCSRLLAFSIVAPTQLRATHVTTLTSCGLYKIDLSVTGGRQPYQYLWSTGAVTQDVAGVAAGNYSVTITDASGCTLTREVIIAPAPPLTCTITPPAASPACLSTGNLITSVVSGATSYLWELTSADSAWSIQGGATTGTVMYKAGNQNSSATFTLTIVKDGCSQTCSYTITSCTIGNVPPDDPPGPTTCSYPNPFRDWCDFDVTCEDEDEIEIDIFDQYGKRVCDPIRSHFSRGEKKTFRIDGTVLRDRMYIYRVRSKHKSSYGKICKAD